MKIKLIKTSNKDLIQRRMMVHRVSKSEGERLDKILAEATANKAIVDTAANSTAASDKELMPVIQSMTYKANVGIISALKLKARLRKWDEMTLLMLNRNLLATVFDAEPITDEKSLIEVAGKIMNEPELADVIKDTKHGKFDIDVVYLGEDGFVKVKIVRVIKSSDTECKITEGPDMSLFTDFLWKIDFPRNNLDVGLKYVNTPK